MKKAIEIRNLKKIYSNFELYIDKLDIPSGEIVGLIGENGAGKTTLIKSMLKMTSIDDGKIKIDSDVGVVLDNSFFPSVVAPKDISFIMKDIYANWDNQLYIDYLDKFNINVNQQLKFMSKGMIKKVEIATALAHKPKLLILDEPTSGLDPIVRNEVLDLFLDFIKDDDHTILLSTHITSDLEHIADEIVFIDNGKIILNKSRDEIIDNYGILKCDVKDFDKIDKEDYISFKKNRYDCEFLIDDIKKCGKKYDNFVVDKITLEELMVLIVKGDK